MTRKTFHICGIVAASFILFFNEAKAQDPSVIIPAPAETIITKGIYHFEDAPKIKFIRAAKDIKPEGYKLKITPKGITVTSADDAGEFYAMQTLAQMTADGTVKELQCCEIYDYPRFSYRGLHFDVSRHFRNLDFLKKQIDAMASFKMNKFHLHFTDGAGWRMQVDALPRLTEFAAWRPYTKWKEWWNGDRHYVEMGTPGAYGGFYTKDELRELVAYAAERHIDVIPEIEMPGHSEEVLAAYPELSCAGEPYKGSDMCIGKEATFEFVEKVLDEVIEIFPYEYIHIGGDEAAKTSWKDCPDCQRRMKEENLESLEQLQSYMIHRVEAYLASKGRKIIGWDEILEGGVSQSATVMSWRGTEGGIQAIKSGNDVIMCPGKYCYLDHAQDAPFLEPESIGGYLPLEMVYGYEPVEEAIPAEGVHHLIGVQANLWTEYVTEDSHAEYMYWPRAVAIAERGWSKDSCNDYENFKARVKTAMDRLSDKGYKVFDISKEYGERPESLASVNHLGVGAKVIYTTPYHKSYQGVGEGTLTDGNYAGWAFGDGKWQGFLSDLDVTVDLGKTMPVRYVGGTFMQVAGADIYMPEKVEIYLSEDGENFIPAGTSMNDIPRASGDLLFRTFSTVCESDARYVRFTAKRGNDRTNWLFLDEIVIN